MSVSWHFSDMARCPNGDLLLPSTAVMVEPLSQQHHRPRCLIRKLQVFDWHGKTFVQLSENESNDGVELGDVRWWPVELSVTVCYPNCYPQARRSSPRKI
jgi:hypothetical protein